MRLLARLSDRPVTLLTLQAAKVLEGMLQRGFTTIRDAAGADGGLAEAVEEGLVRGPADFPLGHGAEPDRRAWRYPAAHPAGRHLRLLRRAAWRCRASPTASRNAAAPRATSCAKGATQIKIVASGGVASPYDPIWNLQYSEEEVRAIVEEARAWHTYVMAHAYSPEAIRRSIDFGVRSIEHANLIDRATAEHVAGAGAFVVPTLVTYDALAPLWPGIRLSRSRAWPSSPRCARPGCGSLEILQAAGVKIGFGTDLLGPMHRYQSREFVIRAEAMSPFDIIRSATTVNAELLNRTGELGVVAPGARADLIAVDGNPLADISLLDGQGEHIDPHHEGRGVLQAVGTYLMNPGRERGGRRSWRLLGEDEEGMHAMAARRTVRPHKSPTIAAVFPRPPATGSWPSYPASSMRCAARSRCSARPHRAMTASPTLRKYPDGRPWSGAIIRIYDDNAWALLPSEIGEVYVRYMAGQTSPITACLTSAARERDGLISLRDVVT